MSLISKICVMFLVWTIGGTLAYVGCGFFWIIRGLALDIYRKDFGREYGSECCRAMYEYLGVPYSFDKDGRDMIKPERKESKLESAIGWLGNGMIWPITVPAITAGFGATYRKYKDEYDRGIRVRKEPS